MLTLSPSQTRTKYKKDDQVYWTKERDDKGKKVKRRYWICCINKKADGMIEYGLKTSPKGKPGILFCTESELEMMESV